MQPIIAKYLDPKDYLGGALPQLLADLNQKGPQVMDALQGAVELHGPATAASSLVDSQRFRPGEFLSTVADTVVPMGHPAIDLPGVLLETYLGGGSQGLVYAGRVLATGKTVAVKVLRSDQMAVRRWALREATICTRLQHPNILRVFQAQAVGAFWVVLMELVQGKELGEACLPVLQVRRCFTQLADALALLAQKRVVHRDIKPGNILIRQHDGSPVLVDFGLAVDLTAPDAEDGKISGTPIFMAPEVFTTGIPDPAWDAYALGVCAVFVLVGATAPYASFTTLMKAKRSGEFDRGLASSLNKVEDADLRNWIAALLDRQPETRLAAVRSARSWLAA